MFKRVSLAVLALMLLALIGCSKAPEAEMQAAKTAMDAAKAAEAELYAPDAYRVANDTLNAANAAKTEQDSKFALFRSYGKSKEMFVRAQALSSKASSDAAAEKERVKQEVMALMTQVKAAMDTANIAVEKAPKGKDTKAEIEMIKTDLAALTPLYAQAEADFNAGKYLTAKTEFEQVMQKAKAITDEIAAAAAKKAGAKAAPKKGK
jgi:hypothetical protein